MCRAPPSTPYRSSRSTDFSSRFEALMARVLARKGRTRVALVGAGAGGVELLLSVERPVAARGRAGRVRRRRTVVRPHHPMSSTSCRAFRRHSARASTPSSPRAASRSFGGAPVTRVEPGRLLLDGHAPVEADEILWTTQAAPARWLARPDCRSTTAAFSRSTTRCASSDATTCSRPATPSPSRRASCRSRASTRCAPARCLPTISAAP